MKLAEQKNHLGGQILYFFFRKTLSNLKKDTCGSGSMDIEDTMDAVLDAPVEYNEETGKNETVVDVGDPLPIEITWHNKPLALDGLIDFYVHTVCVTIEGQKVRILIGQKLVKKS